MLTPNQRHTGPGERRLTVRVALVAGLLILGGARAAQAEPDPTKKPFTFPDPIERKLGKQEARPVDGKIQLMVELVLPKGWKLNAQAPVIYYVDVKGDQGPVDRRQIRRQQKVVEGKSKFAIPISLGKRGDEAKKIDAMEVTLNYFICQEAGKEGEGLCRAGSVVWTFPLHLKADSKKHQVPLTVKVPAA